MTVRLLLFARWKELAGSDVHEVELPSGSTVAALREALAREFPAARELLRSTAFAVDEEFAEDERVLPANAAVALIPPVSGG